MLFYTAPVLIFTTPSHKLPATQPTEGKKHAKFSTFRFNFPSDYFFRRDESSRRKIPLQVILCGSTPVLWHSSHEGALFHTHCTFPSGTHHPQPNTPPTIAPDSPVPRRSTAIQNPKFSSNLIITPHRDRTAGAAVPTTTVHSANDSYSPPLLP